MSIDHAQATGFLQAAALSAALDIETIMQRFPLDAQVKGELAKTAKKLRAADQQADDICEFGSPRRVLASEPETSHVGSTL